VSPVPGHWRARAAPIRRRPSVVAARGGGAPAAGPERVRLALVTGTVGACAHACTCVRACLWSVGGWVCPPVSARARTWVCVQMRVRELSTRAAVRARSCAEASARLFELHLVCAQIPVLEERAEVAVPQREARAEVQRASACACVRSRARACVCVRARACV
jgi:hypothetical protein